MMTFLTYVLVAAIAAAIGTYINNKNRKPAPVPPKPKFGVREAEAAVPNLPGGAFTRETATTARVITAVLGMDYTLPDEVRAIREGLDSRQATSEEEIAGLREQIATEEATIARVQARRNQVNSLAGSFEL